MAESSVDKTEERSLLVKSVKQLVEVEEHVISRAKDIIQESVQNFVEKKIGLLFKLVAVYKDVFARHNVKTKTDFERIVEKYYRYKDVQEATDEWYDSEADIAARGGKVLLISFGIREGAEKWLEETGSEFDMLLDTDRQVYKTFSMKRSVLKVWSISCMVYYAEQLALGRELPSPYEDIEDDPHQMGGNVVLDTDGKIQLIYRSKTASDRPTPDMLLDALKK